MRRTSVQLLGIGLVAVVVALPGHAAQADEGMWTFDKFPSAKMKQKHGFEPSKEWLDHVRLSSARLAGGCSGSFVSASGLVLTNHHCAASCIQQLSTAKKDYMAAGFLARTEKDEVKCPEIEVNQLVAISEVTPRIAAATKGLADQPYNDARKAEMSRIEKECATGDDVRCEVVTLYRGGQYDLYKYRRFQDVRLVFAPEFAIAFFGGDPDNFMFPRYDLDLSFLRIYEGGKPAQTAHHLTWSVAGPKDGDLTFVSGHPGGTSRQLTVAQLEYQRDVALPKRLLRLSELRGLLTGFADRGTEQKRTSQELLFGIENSLKALVGEHEALLEKKLFDAKVAAERGLRAKVAASPARRKAYGGAWDAIARAVDVEKTLRKPMAIERGLFSDLFGIARTLVRATEELPKPNEKRLREYTDANLPALKQGLFSEAPIYEELEIATLTFSLTKLRELMGPDDPQVKKILGKDSPRDLATALVKGTKLKEIAFRRKLFDGGKAAVDASADPMIKLCRAIDPDARAVRKRFEDEVEAVVEKQGALIARARFEVYGTGVYPDATFTLRLSYGQVKGWTEAGKPVAPFTTLGGAFERATGREPFALPKSWLDARGRMDLTTPFNFVTTNDIIGGNSGSPVISRNSEVLGLIFDGNIHSLGGEFGFDEALNRAVAVDTAAIDETLDVVYGARRILDELRVPAGAAGKTGAQAK